MWEYRARMMLAALGFAGVACARAQETAGTLAATEPPAAQGEAAAEAINAPEPWRLEVHPCVWYVGFSGDLKLPRSSGGENRTTDLDTLDLTSPHLSPYGEATLRKGRWLAGLRGFAFGSDQQSQQSAPGSIGDIDYVAGDALSSSLDIAGLEVLGGYTFFKTERSPREAGGFKFRGRMDALAGVRLLDIDSSAALLPTPTSGPTTSQADELSVQPMLGVRFSTDFHEQFSVIVELSVSGQPFGDSSSYGLDIIVGGQWRPIENVGVQIGYRALYLGVKSGKDADAFEFTGAGQGLYAGITFSF